MGRRRGLSHVGLPGGTRLETGCAGTIIWGYLMFVLLSLLFLILRRTRFTGTTLVAPARWTAASLVFLGVVEILPHFVVLAESTLHAWEYAAASFTLCPLMAILGAKRPQNIGWQWIVLSLWGVLLLPVVEMLILWRGGELDEGPARRWFLVILLGVGCSNYLLTRFWFAAGMATAGQLLILSRYLPWTLPDGEHYFAIGNGLIAGAIACAWWQTRRSAAKSNWDAVWIDFRNAYGLVWSLRVLERVNTTNKLAGLSSELTWFGFSSPDAAEETPTPQELASREKTMRTLLRRFVSRAWIDARLT